MKSWMRRKRNGILMVLFLIFILLALLSLAGNRDKTTKVIFVSKTQDDIDFWNSVVEGAEMAAKEYGAEYQMMAPEQEKDAEKQKVLLREAMEEKPDVIVLAPSDLERLMPEAKEIKSRGIRLVLVDSRLSEEIADCVVSTDNYAAGEALGKYASSLCENGDKIGIVSHMEGSSTAQEREKGIRETLEKEGREIVGTVYGESDYSIAYSETKKLLEEHPEITLLAGTNEYATTGAARVIKDMGLKGKVKVVGFDNSKEEIQLLESEVIQGIIVQRAFEMGYLGITLGIETARGEYAEPYIDSGFKLVTKENIYTEENQKLLFPVNNR